MQRTGDAAEQPAGAGQRCRGGIQLRQLPLHRQFGLLHVLRSACQPFAEQRALRTQINIDGAALALEYVDQLADPANQLAHLQQLLQHGDFAAFGRQQKIAGAGRESAITAHDRIPVTVNRQILQKPCRSVTYSLDPDKACCWRCSAWRL
ncbi:hypothetical protein D3C80_1494770 [compost metagenome]